MERDDGHAGDETARHRQPRQDGKPLRGLSSEKGRSAGQGSPPIGFGRSAPMHMTSPQPLSVL
jgi:hypothetical protein